MRDRLIGHPPYFPNLVSYEFHLFSQLGINREESMNAGKIVAVFQTAVKEVSTEG